MDIGREQIAALAAPSLPNQRATRYRGEEQAIVLDTLAAIDRSLVDTLYATLAELSEIVAETDGVPPDIARLQAFAGREDVGDLVHRLRPLGEHVDDGVVAAAIHDIRGGALTSIFLQLSRTRRGPPDPERVRSLSILTRDHLKMMRSVVKDLDPARRARDLLMRPHSLAELGQALGQYAGEVKGQRVAIDVTCDAAADVTESCVECAAVDRAAYNLLNNAVRYTDRPAIGVWLLTVGTDVRVAFANHVPSDARDQLKALLEQDPAVLFGTFSTTGSGYGLRVVSELVGRAYGVPSVEALTRGGYLGAKVMGEHVLTWFHWPLAGA